MRCHVPISARVAVGWALGFALGCSIDDRAVTTGSGAALAGAAMPGAGGTAGSGAAPGEAAGPAGGAGTSGEVLPGDVSQQPPSDGKAEADAGAPEAGPAALVCEVGAVRCDTALDRSRCVEGQWQATSPCSTGQICQGESDPAGACVAVADVCVGRAPSARFCDGSRHVECSADLLTAQVDPCASEALCRDDQGCIAPVCESDEFDCQSANLAGCNAERTGLEPRADCLTVALCRASLGAAATGMIPVGTCLAPACDSGEARCTGATLEVCNAGRTGFDTLTVCSGGAPFCDALHLECDVCRENGRTCTLTGAFSLGYLQCSADGHTQDLVLCPDGLDLCVGDSPNAFCIAPG